MNAQRVHDFGIVDEKGDAFEFSIPSVGEDACRLVAVVQTERGPRRIEVAAVPTELWRPLASAAVKELVNEMSESEREKKAPTLHTGLNRLSPLVGRELGVLLIALMEDGAADHSNALLHAWRELAREERWWLYAKAAAPGQRPGAGWRRALFYALSETFETRAASAAEAQKKKHWEHRQMLVRQARVESYAAQSNPAGADASPSSPATVQAQSNSGRRKGKAKKASKNDGQIDLF